MVADVHPSLHLFLVTGLTLLLAWGPLVAAIAIGIAAGLFATRRARAKDAAPLPRRPRASR